MDNLLIVARQVAILFILMGVGFVCRRRRILDESSVRGVVDLLVLWVTPAVIADAFLRPFDAGMMKELSFAFGAAILCHLVLITLSVLFVRHWADGTQRVLRLASVFSNAGFMGIPLEQAILGARGVFFGVAYIVIFNLTMWSWGYRLMTVESGGPQGFDRHSLVNPGTIGLSIGLVLFLLPWKPPALVTEPLHALADMNTPLAMIMIGYYLAGARLGAVLHMKMAYISAAIRLVISPLLMLALFYPIRHVLDRDMMLATVIAAAAPVAAMVSMFAAKFERDVDVSVALVSGTTILSILTLPPVIALAMTIL